MSAFKTDGTFTTAAVQGGPSRRHPIERDTTAFLEVQRMIQTKSDFARLALNTAHPTIANCYLVEETDPINIGGGLIEWERIYANVPADRNEYESYLYTFVPIIRATGGDGTRGAFTLKVTSRVEYKYYLVGSGGSYATPTDIPTVTGFVPMQDIWGSPVVVDFLSQTTDPTSDDYLTWVAAEAEIAVEDSDVHAWLGNIYERVTRYVIAQ